jgi:putative DNA primase/helicase
MIRRWVQRHLGDAARKRDGEEIVYWLEQECHVDESKIDVEDSLNVANGLLDWRTGELRRHSPEILSTVQLSIEWHPDAYDKRADRFLTEVLPDKETRAVVEEFVGYCLLLDCRYRKAMMFTGDGQNGKSVALAWTTATIGADNVSNVKLQDLEHRFRVTALVDKLVNISADLPRAAVEDSGPFKMLVAGDPIQVERKFRDPFFFRNRAKMIFSANELPRTKDRSGAFFRRWIIVPFPRQFREGTHGFDPLLLEKLICAQGRSYLLRLAVEGLRRLVARGYFVDTTATKEARSAYRRDADSIVAWFEEECEFDTQAWTSNQNAYQSYRNWCDRWGHVAVDISIVARRVRMIDSRLKSERRGGPDGRRRGWRGLRLSGMSGIDSI